MQSCLLSSSKIHHLSILNYQNTISDLCNYGLFVSADGSQLKEVNRRAEIDTTGTMCTEGIIKGNENGGFVCMDETARKMLPYNKEYELKEGKYPGGTQEIAAGRAFFSEMVYSSRSYRIPLTTNSSGLYSDCKKNASL